MIADTIQNTNPLVHPLGKLTITHKSLEVNAVYVGAKTDCSFRYGINCRRDIPVPIIRARKPFPQVKTTEYLCVGKGITDVETDVAGFTPHDHFVGLRQ